MGFFGAIGGAIKGVANQVGKLPGLPGGNAPTAPAVQAKPVMQPGTPAAPLSKKAASGNRSFSAKRRF